MPNLRHVHHRLDNGTLGCYYYHLVVGIIEGGTDTPRVSERKCVATAGHSANDIAAIPDTGGPPEHPGNIDVVFYLRRQFAASESLLFVAVVEALVLLVEFMAYLFEHDKRIGIDTWMLPVCHNGVEKFIDVGQIEIPAEGEVAGLPVIPPQKGVDIRDTGAAGGAVTQMPHIKLSDKGGLC